MTDYVIDLECDGLKPTHIHCLSIDDCNGKAWTLVKSKDIIDFFDTLDSTDRVIGHNFIRFDAVVLKNLLNIDIKAGIVDTTALSWYLYPNIGKHGLAFWGERLDIKKPVVEDWDNQPIEVYIERCEEDVKINLALWKMMKEYLDKLYEDGDSNKLIRYLAHKMNCATMQEASKWKLDIDKGTALLSELTSNYKIAVDALATVMPQVPKMAKRTRPAKPYKKDGSLSATGEKWDTLTKENDLPFEYDEVIKVVVGQTPPNPSSVPQIKDWLVSLGWKPATYSYNEAGKSVPQIKKPDGNLCDSVDILIKSNPELEHLKTMTVVKHRIGAVQGLLDNADNNGFVEANVQGFTNTLRFKHRVCVNLPSERKPYGKELRSLFTVRKQNHILCGSDMASLEDRTKQHYMWDYDPEYVKAMTTPGFDPHLDLALSAGAVTQEQVDEYKSGNKTPEILQLRHNYKGGNYACTYGAGATTLSRQLGISEVEAGKIHKAYWKRNWALKKIAKDAVVKTVDGQLWLWNPVSQLYYFLKADKDKFSTLNQGTGTYCFDMWLGFIIRKRKQLTAQFHDEVILELQESKQEDITLILKEAIQNVNKTLKLNRDLDCDISFGKDYSQIH
jgi:hypothetical protein|tara:strand:- start:3552 stop:5399 length:1848 start_codon:yes stop_codon:yes gene_type:complete